MEGRQEGGGEAECRTRPGWGWAEGVAGATTAGAARVMGVAGPWGQARRTRGAEPLWHHKQGDSSYTPHHLPAPTALAPTVGAGNGKTTQLHPRT